MSSIPATIFWFDIDNRNNNKDIEMDFFFNFPDIINLDSVELNKNENGIFMNKLYNKTESSYFTAGNMSFTLQSCITNTNQCNSPIKGSVTNSHNIFTNWKTFMTGSISNNNKHNHIHPMKGPHNTTIYKHYAFMSKNNIKIAANSVYSFSAILSWFFPYRTFNNNQQYLGNYYNTLFSSSTEVNNNILKTLPNIIQNIISWQQLFARSNPNLYPNYLRDVYINGPGYIARTSFYLQPNSGGGNVPPQIGYDRKGSDLPNMPIYLNFSSNYTDCWALCNQTISCKAWTYYLWSVANNCQQFKQPTCWLKGAVPSATVNKCDVSGVVSSNNDKTGLWRQAESWSCFQIDPPHIHGYRSLAYNLIFGNTLDRGTLNMYTYGQIDNGLVSELFGGGCGGVNGVMGQPSGGARGDDNSIYVLDMYSQFKWYKDGSKYVGDRYKYVKAAMNWIIEGSIPHKYGLPYR
eukprot:62838_1